MNVLAKKLLVAQRESVAVVGDRLRKFVENFYVAFSVRFCIRFIIVYFVVGTGK